MKPETNDSNQATTEEEQGKAICGRIESYSIGIVNEKERRFGKTPDGRDGDEETPGSASLIRWGEHYCILTARHNVVNADTEDLRFFFNAPGSREYRTLREELFSTGYAEMSMGRRVTICKIYRCAWEDIAVLTIDRHARGLDLAFHDLSSSGNDPVVGDTLYCLGFPTYRPVEVHVDRTGNREHRLLGLMPRIWSNTVIAKPDSLVDAHDAEIPYDPDNHFLISWDVADPQMGMHGFSGAATWTDVPFSNRELWFPKLMMTGMCTHYYKLMRVGRMIRSSILKRFLQEALGADDPQTV